MPYNYFCCRSHNPPVKYAALQPAVPGVLASPQCPTCKRFMELYGSGSTPTDPNPGVPPVPPPVPPLPPAFAISNDDVLVYSGSGSNPGHDHVTWEITRNAAKMDLTIKLMLKDSNGLSVHYKSEQTFKLADSLLDTTQPGAKKDWWVKAPTSIIGADKQLWHSFDLAALLGVNKPGALPDTIDIGVKLGDAAFGLIHLLAGHASGLRNVGPYTVTAFGDPRVDIYRTILLLQSGLQRFVTNSIKEIYYDADKDKLTIMGSHDGLIAVTRVAPSPRYSITTIYNTQSANGTRIYSRT